MGDLFGILYGCVWFFVFAGHCDAKLVVEKLKNPAKVVENARFIVSLTYFIGINFHGY